MHRKSAYFLFVAVLAVLVIGIVMLFSTSAFARDSKGDVYFFVKRQGIWIAGGLVFCAIGALMDYHFWRKTWWIWFGLAIVMLAFCFVPHIGMLNNGSRRWIGLGQSDCNHRNLGSWRRSFFRVVVFALGETERSLALWLCYPLLDRRATGRFDYQRSRSWNDRTHRRDRHS